MRIVIALGGNALIHRGESPDTKTQRRHLRDSMAALSQVAREHDLVLTHGNGPQVGLLALQSEAVPDLDPTPLDVLGAQTQGMIGYMIEDEIRDALRGEREVATLLTQVVVDADDPAFSHPSKPIGPVYSRETAKRLARERRWTVVEDGESWRRVVPSPEPRRILEIRSVRLLLEANVIVICAGGGGVPVVADRLDGDCGLQGWRGAEAVVDKDLSAALLADQLDADALVLLTDVDAVYEGWRTARARPIRQATPTQLRRTKFAPGSMGPKVEAACRFVDVTTDDRVAYIGALHQVERLLGDQVGTKVTRNARSPGHETRDRISSSRSDSARIENDDSICE